MQVPLAPVGPKPNFTLSAPAALKGMVAVGDGLVPSFSALLEASAETTKLCRPTTAWSASATLCARSKRRAC
jgi:hypothetical protein